MPVVFDPRVGGSLVGHLLSAITGPAIPRKTSFLLAREEERVFAEGIVIRDDLHRERGLRSKTFDGEGMATSPSIPVLTRPHTGWLLVSPSASQLWREPKDHSTPGTARPPGP